MSWDPRAAVLAAVAGLLLAVAPAQAATKTYSVVLTPATAPKATVFEFQATITNRSEHQRLGAVNLTAPTGFDVRSASLAGAGTASLDGRTVKLRDLSLPAQGQLLVHIVAETPAPFELVKTYRWEMAAKHSNDFNGTGNDFTLLAPPQSQIETTVDQTTPVEKKVSCAEDAGTDACQVSLTWVGTGPIYEDGTPVPDDGGPLSAPSAPSAAQTRAAGPVDGLLEPAPTIIQTTFRVTITVEAEPSTDLDAGELKLTLPSASINCQQAAETSPVTGAAFGPRNRDKVVTYTVDADVALTKPPDGACFGRPMPFLTSPTKPLLQASLTGTSPFFVGVLPECPDNNPALRELRAVTPCTSEKALIKPAGDNRLVVQVPYLTDDPSYRG